MKYTMHDLIHARGVSEPLREAVKALINRIEAAESALSNLGVTPDEARDGLARHKALIARLEAAEKERDSLRAKVAEMETQEPVGWLLDGDFYEVKQMSLYKDNEPLPGQTALYALPGAQGEEK